jgi:hypothetical protein
MFSYKNIIAHLRPFRLFAMRSKFVLQISLSVQQIVMGKIKKLRSGVRFTACKGIFSFMGMVDKLEAVL